jgi:hypothetical protein
LAVAAAGDVSGWHPLIATLITISSAEVACSPLNRLAATERTFLCIANLKHAREYGREHAPSAGPQKGAR